MVRKTREAGFDADVRCLKADVLHPAAGQRRRGSSPLCMRRGKRFSVIHTCLLRLLESIHLLHSPALPALSYSRESHAELAVEGAVGVNVRVHDLCVLSRVPIEHQLTKCSWRMFRPGNKIGTKNRF